jgi:hypothetical protein
MKRGDGLRLLVSGKALDDQIKEDEMNGACSMRRRDGKLIQNIG